MSERPKLLLHSNASWSVTGYGSQSALFAPRLNEHFDVAISAFYGLEAARLKLNGVTVMPGLGQSYGNETIVPHAEAHFGGDKRAGLVLTLLDVWVLTPEVIRELDCACWCPIDHEPAPPMVKTFFRESTAIPIAMSRFGEKQLAEFDPLYVPHGVDTETFQPREKRASRKMTGLPEDAFIVGAVAANKGNPSRKGFVELLLAFSMFRQKHENAVLYLHTESTGRSDGIPLNYLIREFGIPPKAVLFCDQYRYSFDPYSPELMSHVYSSFDVLLNPARGEGFGLCVLEAQACGTPVIVTDFSAMAEVCGAGWRVEWEHEWSPQLAWQARASIDDIVSALESCYRLSAQARADLGADAVEHAAQYEVGRVMEEHFLPALAEAQKRISARAPETLGAMS